jgi:hypothetical protein
MLSLDDILIRLPAAAAASLVLFSVNKCLENPIKTAFICKKVAIC